MLSLILLLAQPKDLRLVHNAGVRHYQIRHLKAQGRTGEPNIIVLTYDDVTDGTHVEAQVKAREVPKRHRTDYVGKGTLRRPGTGAVIVYTKLECKGKTVSFRVSSGGTTMVKHYDEEVERRDD